MAIISIHIKKSYEFY